MATFRGKHSVEPHLADVLERAVERGWKPLVNTKTGHFRLAHPSGQGLVIGALKVRDRRAILNIETSISRAEQLYGVLSAPIRMPPPKVHTDIAALDSHEPVPDSDAPEFTPEQIEAGQKVPEEIPMTVAMTVDYPPNSQEKFYQDVLVLHASGYGSRDIASLMDRSLAWVYIVLNDYLIRDNIRIPGFSDDEMLAVITHRSGRGSRSSSKPILKPESAATIEAMLQDVLKRVKRPPETNMKHERPATKSDPVPEPTRNKLDDLVGLKNQINSMIDRLVAMAAEVSTPDTPIEVVNADRLKIRAMTPRTI